MTPEQERALLAATAAGLDDDAREAFAELLELIRAGTAPRDAVEQVMAGFADDMADALAYSISAVSEEETTTEEALQISIGPVSLSSRLYQESSELSAIVQGMYDTQERAFSELEAFALAVYLAWRLRERGGPPPAITARNPSIPQRVRTTLLRTPAVQTAIAAAFERMAPAGLSIEQQAKAYEAVKDDLARIKAGVAREALEKRAEVAFAERIKNFARRIVGTETHRAFVRVLAESIMADDRVQWVQVLRGSRGAPPCFCDLFTGRDLFGKGPGVYPKERAPLPLYHPNCYCWWKRRPDIDAAPTEPEEGADAYFLRRLGQPIAARIVGSRAKLQRVLAGESVESVFNDGKRPQYHLRTGRDV